tara:strand:- start:2533 stop:3066 length:534 start_codon:yes stop_codon:yes gene_type:complete
LTKINCLLSKCQRYRWELNLDISEKNKKLIFIGLNPSLSNSNYLDNTTKKIIKISNKYEYGNIKIINLFSLISKDPKILFNHKEPLGIHTNKIINDSLQYWSSHINCHIWLGWGNNGNLFDRNKYVYKLLKKYSYLKKNKFKNPLGPLLIKKTKFKNPVHPLYCKDNSNLIEDYSII